MFVFFNQAIMRKGIKVINPPASVQGQSKAIKTETKYDLEAMFDVFALPKRARDKNGRRYARKNWL